jgi:tetratricopeptide (TPR) repeat protein
MTADDDEAGRVSPSREHPLSLTALAESVDVRPAVLRSWVEHGLVCPSHRAGGLLFFSFRQIGAARSARAGFGARRIAKALQRARTVVADAEAALAGLEPSGAGSRLCLRTPDGRICELDGQQLFPFAAGDGEDSVRQAGGRIRGLRSVVDWFEVGVDAEAAGRLPEAIHAYQQALRGETATGGPRETGATPAIAFNLGNCLYAMDRRDEARDRFADAVAADPEYAEAWNNLGNVEGELGHAEAAIAAYRRALAIVPYYADAHYNLADALAGAGDLASARRHWQAYLSYDPNSRWAEQVRRRLGGRSSGRGDGDEPLQ